MIKKAGRHDGREQIACPMVMPRHFFCLIKAYTHAFFSLIETFILPGSGNAAVIAPVFSLQTG